MLRKVLKYIINEIVLYKLFVQLDYEIKFLNLCNSILMNIHCSRVVYDIEKLEYKVTVLILSFIIFLLIFQIKF